MIAGSEIVSFEADVIDVDGETTTCMVVRVGLFNAVCDGKYLEFAASKGSMLFFQDNLRADTLEQQVTLHQHLPMNKLHLASIQLGLLEEACWPILFQTPSLSERAAQGKEIGYAIIVVGLLGTLLALYKLFVLYVMGRAVKKQADSKDLDQKNPLGRVLKVGEEHFSKRYRYS